MGVPTLVGIGIAIATHGIVGYTLGAYLLERPVAGLVGGIIPDIDYLFPAVLGWPFVHRGITHSILAGVIATVPVMVWNRRAGLAFGIGYGGQLLSDLATPRGIPFLYPVVEGRVSVHLGTTVHSAIPTVVIWIGCLAVLYAIREEKLDVPRW